MMMQEQIELKKPKLKKQAVIKETKKDVSKIKIKEKIVNPMRAFYIDKIILSAGATGDNLMKAKKLLELFSENKAQIIASTKRIPDFDVSPGLEVGTRLTLRGKKAVDLLKRLLGAIDNELNIKQISDNHFSFGIKEYIEIPEIEYHRDIGIRGFNVTVVFSRPGIRVKLKKMKRGKWPKKQQVSKKEITNYMEEVFKTKIK
ncbi:MAG: 50S ribosomal protein L5 [Nanoarchaeota archaeon]